MDPLWVALQIEPSSGTGKKNWIIHYSRLTILYQSRPVLSFQLTSWPADPHMWWVLVCEIILSPIKNTKNVRSTLFFFFSVVKLMLIIWCNPLQTIKAHKTNWGKTLVRLDCVYLLFIPLTIWQKTVIIATFELRWLEISLKIALLTELAAQIHLDVPVTYSFTYASISFWPTVFNYNLPNHTLGNQVSMYH